MNEAYIKESIEELKKAMLIGFSEAKNERIDIMQRVDHLTKWKFVQIGKEEAEKEMRGQNNIASDSINKWRASFLVLTGMFIPLLIVVFKLYSK